MRKNFDIKKISGNAAQLKRKPTENKKIQKLLQIRARQRKINQPKEQTPGQEQETADSNTTWSNETWIKLANILDNIRK